MHSAVINTLQSIIAIIVPQHKGSQKAISMHTQPTDKENKSQLELEKTSRSL